MHLAHNQGGRRRRLRFNILLNIIYLQQKQAKPAIDIHGKGKKIGKRKK